MAGLSHSWLRSSVHSFHVSVFIRPPAICYEVNRRPAVCSLQLPASHGSFWKQGTGASSWAVWGQVRVAGGGVEVGVEGNAHKMVLRSGQL